MTQRLPRLSLEHKTVGEVALAAEMVPAFRAPHGTAARPAVCLRVSDTGPGIRPQDMATLFQPFRQIDSGLARQHEGTGLGLAISRRLADLLGGEISATSGTMKARILLIEDNDQNRYLATFLLERRGHEVVSAETGPAGLDLAHRLRPDLILLDIQLPGMDGHAVARSLKSDSQLKVIPVVAVTSCAMAGDREKILACGAEGYIEKPIDPRAFVATVESSLRPPEREPAP